MTSAEQIQSNAPHFDLSDSELLDSPSSPPNLSSDPDLFAEVPKACSLRVVTQPPPQFRPMDSSAIINARAYDAAFRTLQNSVDNVVSRSDLPRFLMQLEASVRPRGLDSATNQKLLLDLVMSKAARFVSGYTFDSYQAARLRLLSRHCSVPSQRLQHDVQQLLQSRRVSADDHLSAFEKFRHLVNIHNYAKTVLRQTGMSPELLCDYAIEFLPAARRQVHRHALKKGDHPTLEDVFDSIEQDLDDWQSDEILNLSEPRQVALTSSPPSRYIFAEPMAELSCTVQTPPVRCQFCGKRGVYSRVCSCAGALQSRRQVTSRPPVTLPNSVPLNPVRCFSCQEPGHVRRDCPLLIDRRPQPYQSSSGISRGSSSRLKCIFCNGNHISRTCSSNPLRRDVTLCNYCGNQGHSSAVCRIKSNDEVSSQTVLSVAGNEEAAQKTSSSQ